MILFKHFYFPPQFEKLDPRLRQIIDTMENLMWSRWHCDLLVTSIYRNDESYHRFGPPYRFIDLSLMERGNNELVREIVNKLYPRADGKKTIPDLRHGTAPHFHVQVPPT